MNRRSTALPLLLGAAVALAGCSADGAPAPAKPAAVAKSAAPTPSKTQPKAAPAVNPLTGLPPKATAPVVVFKVDNAPIARRYQRGLERAAVVYQELVEGGATRYAAVFSDTYAGEVGPIRSVRDADLELLRPYGRVVMAFSGGNAGTVRFFAKQAKEGRVIDGSFDTHKGLYRRGEKRPDAYNFFTTPVKMQKAFPQSAKAKDVGLRFGPAGKGTATRALTARFSKLSSVTVKWVPSTKRWEVRQNGTLMPFSPSNVVVQRVHVKDGGYRDVTGNATPYSITTGSGEALVLRDGMRYGATWKRLGHDTGPRFLDKAGKDVLLRPGRTLVLLLPVGEAVTPA